MLSHNQVMTLFDQMNISFEAGRCSRNFQLQMNFKYFLGNLARNKLSVLMYTCLKLLLASNELNTFNCGYFCNVTTCNKNTSVAHTE